MRDQEAQAGGRVWGALTLDVPPALADELAGELASATLGAELVTVGPGLCRLWIYVESPDAVDRVRDEAVRALHRAGLSVEASEPTAHRVEDGRWVEVYQAGLRPFALGRRFRVDPSGEAAPVADRIPLVLVPGRAFGTGEHATTRLAAEALERHARQGSRWLDLGAGSGILAMVAAHLGASEVLALDVDDEAVRVALEVVRRNGLAERIRVETGSLDESASPTWDGVVANIHAPFFLEQAGVVAGALVPGGMLICTGILESDVPAIGAALAAAGLREIEREAADGWAVLVVRRDAKEHAP